MNHFDSTFKNMPIANYCGVCERSAVPVCRRWTEGLIRRISWDSADVSSWAVGTFVGSDDTGPCWSCWAVLSSFLKRGALNNVLPVEKKITDSLGGACNVFCCSSASWSPLVLLVSPSSLLFTSCKRNWAAGVNACCCHHFDPLPCFILTQWHSFTPSHTPPLKCRKGEEW